MPGKYHQFRNSLQRRPVETIPFGEKILLRKAELSGLSKNELANSIKELKNQKKKLEDHISNINFELITREKLLVDHLEATGEEKFTLSGGGSFFIQYKVYPNVKDKEQFRLWCIENGYERQMHLHNKTVESIVGERLKEGMDMPPGVEPFLDAGIGVRNILDKEDG